MIYKKSLLVEKHKAAYTFRLDLIKLIVDKIFLGVIVVGVGYFANIALEDYKKKQIEAHFFLEKKFGAVQEITAALNKVFNSFYQTTIDGQDKAKSNISNYESDLQFHSDLLSAADTATKYSLILSKKAADHTQAMITFLEGAYYKERSKRVYYREFMYAMMEMIGDHFREELGLSPDVSDYPNFTIDEFRFNEVSRNGPSHFLDTNYERWKAKRKYYKY
jgi:hypothetical protein